MVNIIGGPVREHVQAAADTIQAQFPDGIAHISTYEGHDPTRELALDIFPKNPKWGDVIAAWVVENIERLSVDYIIWWQRIFNPEILMDWRPMADRGGITQNHKDHIHLTFELKGSTLKPQGDTDIMTPEERDQLQRIDSLVVELNIAIRDKEFGLQAAFSNMNQRLDAIQKILENINGDAR